MYLCPGAKDLAPGACNRLQITLPAVSVTYYLQPVADDLASGDGHCSSDDLAPC